MSLFKYVLDVLTAVVRASLSILKLLRLNSACP